MWKNIVQPGMPQMTIWHMRITCCIPKSTNTHPEYAILTAFPLQQWLHELASVLRHTYLVSLISTLSFLLLSKSHQCELAIK